MARTTLFDAVPLRSGPAGYSEPHFTFLNRRDGPPWQRVRDLLEAWYEEFPDDDGDLRARFRKSDIRQHAPAWWELYTFILFRRLGYSITVHPSVPGGTGHPDFLISQGDSRTYVECVVLFEDGSRKTTDSQAWLQDCIDGARNPDFMVSIRFERHGSLRPKKRQVTRQIEEWLASLDYDSVRQTRSGESETPSKSFRFADSRVLLRALPVHPDARGDDMGRIGMGPASGTFVISSVDEIRTVLKAKARQCRGADAPVIVAILNWTTFATNQEAEEALLGSRAVSYIPGDRDSVHPVRNTDGYWHPGPPPRGGNISAVLYGEHNHTSRVVGELPTLWLNPWAHKPIADQMPFETHTAHDTGEVFRAMEASTTADTVFGLPPDWPGFLGVSGTEE